MRDVASEQSALTQLLAQEGRALAISLPDGAIAMAREFRTALTEIGLEGQVFAAHKATDRTSLVQRLVRETGVGVDVASCGELEACLDSGIAGSAMIVTGPKSDALLARAVECGVRAIVIDSLGELERLIALKAHTYPDVLLRLTRSMLNRPGVTRVGRFGLDRAGYEAALRLLAHSQITLRGLHFHIDTRLAEEKSYAVGVALDLLAELPARGFDHATVLDIGGGFGCSYGLTASDIDSFDAEFKRAMKDATLTTYQQRSFGLKKLPDGRVTGEFAGIDMPVFPVGVERLRAIFMASQDGQTLAERARDMLVDIWCEPGRALFTPAGVVVSEIIDVSERDGRLAVVTNVQQGQVLFDGYEVLVDPLHVPTEQSNSGECSGYVFGHLCMESDILSYRPMRFAQWPRPGDILLWTHTGGYRMHMSQTNAIMHPDMARYRYEHKEFLRDET